MLKVISLNSFMIFQEMTVAGYTVKQLEAYRYNHWKQTEPFDRCGN